MKTKRFLLAALIAPALFALYSQGQTADTPPKKQTRVASKTSAATNAAARALIDPATARRRASRLATNQPAPPRTARVATNNLTPQLLSSTPVASPATSNPTNTAAIVRTPATTNLAQQATLDTNRVDFQRTPARFTANHPTQLLSTLNLSTNQAAAFIQFQKSYTVKVTELINDKGLSPREKTAKLHALNEERKAMLTSVLTTSQRELLAQATQRVAPGQTTPARIPDNPNRPKP